MKHEQQARKLIDALTLAVKVDINLTGDVEPRIEIVGSEALIAAAFAEVERGAVERDINVVDRLLPGKNYGQGKDGRWTAYVQSRRDAVADLRALIDTPTEPTAPDPTKPESRPTLESMSLPCPFCGGAATVAEYGDGQHIVFCASCDCHPSPEETASDAITAWNRRSGRADPTKALAGFFQEWFECGTPNAIAIKYGLVQIADRTSQLELTDLGYAALRLAEDGG